MFGFLKRWKLRKAVNQRSTDDNVSMCCGWEICMSDDVDGGEEKRPFCTYCGNYVDEDESVVRKL